MQNIKSAALATGINGNKNGKLSRVEAARKNGKLGGRPPMAKQAKENLKILLKTNRIASAIVSGSGGTIEWSKALKMAEECIVVQEAGK